ncbi:hypothetical protein IJV79_01680 [bacterium]|nr:hypothetical protein [bacterium]
MDTVFVEFEKRFKLPLNFLTVAVAMVLCLFSSKVLFAQESTLIANGIVPVINQVISNEDESKKFDESVNKRYRTGVIRDVDLGIKHIKMVKSINGRRIRINVVEVNRNLNPSLNVAPVLASDKLNSRVGISKIARKNNSIVAINGTFFKP